MKTATKQQIEKALVNAVLNGRLSNASLLGGMLRRAAVIMIAMAAFACQEEEIAARKDTTVDETVTCESVIETNLNDDGEKVTIKAELTGCNSGVVFRAETRKENGAAISSFRKPSACDVTEQAISFAFKGEKIHVGLYPCGSNPSGSGRSYTLTITQGAKVMTVTSKVGSTVEYTIQ